MGSGIFIPPRNPDEFQEDSGQEEAPPFRVDPPPISTPRWNDLGLFFEGAGGGVGLLSSFKLDDLDVKTGAMTGFNLSLQLHALELQAAWFEADVDSPSQTLTGVKGTPPEFHTEDPVPVVGSQTELASASGTLRILQFRALLPVFQGSDGLLLYGAGLSGGLHMIDADLPGGGREWGPELGLFARTGVALGGRFRVTLDLSAFPLFDRADGVPLEGGLGAEWRF